MIVLTRSMDVTRLNVLANYPGIREHILGGEGALDLTPLVDNPGVVVLEAEHGAFLLIPILGDVYELHTMFLPNHRGRYVLDAAQEMLEFMFTRTSALEVVTKVPGANRPAGMAATHAGFKERFRREGTSYRAITVEEWALRSSVCEQRGHEFHLMLEWAKRKVGSQLPVHPDDPAHDCIVGAGLMMAARGQLPKGVGFFNRWAAFAGYASAVMVAPDLVDIQDAIIMVRDGEVGVLKCRLEPPLPRLEQQP